MTCLAQISIWCMAHDTNKFGCMCGLQKHYQLTEFSPEQFSSEGKRYLCIACAFTFQPLTPLKRGWRKGTTVLSEAYQHVFSTLVHALRYLSFPFQLQVDISPTREHKKWVKSSICGQTPFRGDFSCRQRTDLHMCNGVCVCVWERERERLHDWEREREMETFFFFLL